MSAPTAITLFSGGGFAALGLQQAGYQVVGAVEYDTAIAACYAANVGPVEVHDLSVAPARYFARWAGVDLLQASPPCPNFSRAKTGGYETVLDVRLAGAVCRAVRVIRPRTFLLENVRGYVHSASYARIVATVQALGYTIHAAILNSADYGVPQTRERLILRAVRTGPVPALLPTHRKRGDWFSAPWVGWYAAIEDLVDTLPSSTFAPWQLARLPALLADMGVLVDSRNSGQEYGKLHRTGNEPALTVTTVTRPSHMPRAFLYPPGDGDGTTPLRGAAEPRYTVVDASRQTPRAFLLSDQYNGAKDGAQIRRASEPATTCTAGANHKVRAWLDPDQGRVVALTPPALARFQSVPPSYVLPDHARTACRIIGNGVPVLLMQRLGEGLRTAGGDV